MALIWFAAISLILLLIDPRSGLAQDDQQTSQVGLQDLAWIAGSWQGEAMGGRFEETWSKPTASSMMGMFKFYTDEGIGFYELLTIVPKGDSLVLRLKHFDSQLVGWEEKDDSVEFPFVSKNESEIRFDGLVFQKKGADSMLIKVTVDQGNGPQVIDFHCQRSVDTSTAKQAIDRVLNMDALISQQRNLATHHVPIADAIRIYLTGLDAIDFEDCPQGFTSAFRKHRDSWEKSLAFFESHADLRGEMHDVLDKIREKGTDAATALDGHFKHIMDTWSEVESNQQIEAEK